MVLDIKEYEGSQPYVFVSYCRADSRLCGELLEKFRSAGIRFWYDHQINPGEDWINIIASHLKGCGVCVTIITKKFTESYNCNKELAFAKEKHIPIAPILVDDVQMTTGMELMLAGSQHLRISSDGSHNFAELLKSEQIQKCRDPEQEHREPEKILLSVDPETGKSCLLRRRSGACSIDAQTVIADHRGNPIVRAGVREESIVLQNCSSGDVYADYRRIAPGETLETLNGTVLMFGGELRILCAGSLLEKLVKQGRIGLLRCDRTRECMPILSEPLILGRKHIWAKGTLDDELVNGDHCTIEERNGFYVRDLNSVNGTLLNGGFTDGDTLLSNGDSLQMGQTYLNFCDVRLDITE